MQVVAQVLRGGRDGEKERKESNGMHDKQKHICRWYRGYSGAANNTAAKRQMRGRESTPTECESVSGGAGAAG